MPRTRSQCAGSTRGAEAARRGSAKGDSEGTSTSATAGDTTNTESTSGTTNSGSTGTTSKTTGTEMTHTTSATETTHTTSATETTHTTSATETLKEREDITRAGSEARKNIQDKATTNKLNSTVVGAASSHRARSTRSDARRVRLEAELKLAEAKAELALAQLKLARCDEDECTDEDSVAEDLEDRTAHVENWIQASMDGQQDEPVKKGSPKDDPPREDPPTSATVKPEDTGGSRMGEIGVLTAVLEKALNRRELPAPQYMHELPHFDGTGSEWLSFKVVYEDTCSLFSDAQNIARLRRAIVGQAREAIKSVLYSGAPPQDVMQALKMRFGRSNRLLSEVMEKIRALPRMTDDARSLNLFACHIANSVATIRGLEEPEFLRNPDLVNNVVDKFTSLRECRWFDYIADMSKSEHQDLTVVSRFLTREAERCGGRLSGKEREREQQHRDERRRPPRQATHTTAPVVDREGDTGTRRWEPGRKASGYNRPTVSPRFTKCVKCQEAHFVCDCPQFKKMSVDDRWAFVKKQRLCFKCLSNRHQKDACRRGVCRTCGRWHHELLHAERSEEPKARPSREEGDRDVATNVAAPVHAVQTTRAYLKMVPVEVIGPKGVVRVLALLDEGSTVSLVDAAVAAQVGATGKREELVLETVGGKLIKKTDSKRLRLRIKGVHHDKVRNLNRVRTLDDLKLTPQCIDKKKIEKCPHLTEMIDVLYYNAEAPKLLIGQDNWELIVSRDIRRGAPGQPIASFTELGWVLHGYDSQGSRPVNVVNNVHNVYNLLDIETHNMIKEHFAIESLGIQPRRPSNDSEGRALSILEKTCNRLEDGRFEVGLLWKSDNESMPESYTAAERRLRGIERKLDKDAGLRAEYSAQVQHLLDCGYAEEVKGDCASEREWYLPHFAVSHPVKKKIRLVFDAAAKSQGKSLNDALLPGPDLLQSLFGVLLRFRQGSVAIAADIKEMFLQVKIREQDRDSLRFLWRSEKKDVSPTIYRMTSVIFGATSSPCTAIYVKNRNAKDFENEFPDAVRAIERNHYMDDYLYSCNSKDNLTTISNEINLIHRQAGFELRGWSSNCADILQQLNSSENERREVEIGDREEKTLGLRWKTDKDCLAFRSELRSAPDCILSGQGVPTKRQVTSAVMTTFDPLGLISPILIQGKKLLQCIWRSGVDWDERIEERENDIWRSYIEKLSVLKMLEIPRCMARTCTEGELHVFVDASESAYAAAVYWRSIENGVYYTSLVAGKARVTPLKPVSIPRLELQAALMGSRLARAVEAELDLHVKRKTYWTDSSIVLSWIKSDPRTFKTFVAHRLAEIEDLTQPQEWRWVPTALNPADDATRDAPDDFTAEHRWFTGPEFLRREESSWPAPRSFGKKITGEEKESTEVTAATSDDCARPDPDKFSSWRRLWRTMARVLQFIERCRTKHRVHVSRRLEKQDPTWGRRKKKETKSTKIPRVPAPRYIPIEAELLQRAEEILLRRSQTESFGRDIELLKKGKPLEGSSKLKKLDVTLENDVIRLRGRIDAVRGVVTEFKRPIILDGKNKIARLIMEDYHKKFNHANHATVMNEIRQRFMILGLRTSLRAIQHNCQWCRVKKATPTEIPTGNLPGERLRHGEPPFTCTGVDYFGPMVVTIGRRQEKRWGALFTCMTTRAVHIELAASLSADSMIMALRRFAARRGMPRLIFSDNGTNFTRSNVELKQAWEQLQQEELVTEAEKIGVQWKFIAPGAPNMGGAWERLVQSVKTALNATLRERHPREEVLHTLLLEAEHVVNSRPLTNLADNPEEEALTPNHFLIGRSCGAPRVGAFVDIELVGRESWKTTQRLADHFWQRWIKEYLPTLLPRKIDGRTSSTDLRAGDVVLVVDSSLPRCTWPRGRIVTTYPGPDGRTRIVDVSTRGGVLRRPSSKIVLLVPGESPSQGIGAEHEGEDVGDHIISK